MFERFTDRARKAMALANTVAAEFGHSTLTPHHVLLGILREGGSNAITVLGQLEVNLDELLEQTTKHLRGQTRVFSLSGQVTVQGAMGVINDANAVAKEFNVGYVGCEHLLLAMARAQTTPVSQLLARFSVTAKRLTAVLRAITASAPALRDTVTPAEAELARATRHEAGRPYPGAEPGLAAAGVCPLCDCVRGDVGDLVVIADLELSRVFLGDNQGCAGWCVLMLRSHVEHLDELAVDRQAELFREVAAVARAIREVFPTSGAGGGPPRINYECLGNQTPHIHWHVIPRHADDPEPRSAVWGRGPEQLKGSMTKAQREELAGKLRAALDSP